jgi:serine phosphatase RsbU (regulator of sigma subunit)
VCFTDGATESRGRGGFFGETGVATAVACAAGNSADTAAALEAAILDFTGGTPGDDLAILVLQPAPTVT